MDKVIPLILGVDPGFAKIGYTVVRLQDPLDPVTMGLIETKQSDKKLKVLSSDDNFRRAREIAEALDRIVKSSEDIGRIVAICAEAKSFPRNASAAAKVAMTWGVLAAICVRTGIPLLQARPQEIKQKMCGKADASKLEIQEACGKVFGSKILSLVEGIKRSDLEHPYDALAAVVACSDSETLRLVRRMVSL